ncbi:hypothetical protein [Lentilactobacillus senioris]|uniref:hypothetical protein n=1 Tax=Lentilactobacillus senioris TaxID=931534 RepID=UPI003D2E7F91
MDQPGFWIALSIWVVIVFFGGIYFIINRKTVPFWQIVIYFFILIMAVPSLVGIIMSQRLVEGTSIGSKDGWLGFWGGYLGAIISILGVYWSVTRTMNTEKENDFSQSRPFFVVQLKEEEFEKGKRYWFHDKDNINELTFENFPNLFSKDNDSKKIPILSIQNLSTKRLMAVQLITHSKKISDDIDIDQFGDGVNIPSDGSNDNIIIYNINKVKGDWTSKILLDNVIYNDGSKKFDIDTTLNNIYNNIKSIEILYTTELREVCKLVFDVEENSKNKYKAKINYRKNIKFLENKNGSEASIVKYTSNGFYEDDSWKYPEEDKND